MMSLLEPIEREGAEFGAKGVAGFVLEQTRKTQRLLIEWKKRGEREREREGRKYSRKEGKEKKPYITSYGESVMAACSSCFFFLVLI